MEKKELRWYETPAMEVVEMEVSAPLLDISNVDDTEEKPWWE